MMAEEIDLSEEQEQWLDEAEAKRDAGTGGDESLPIGENTNAPAEPEKRKGPVNRLKRYMKPSTNGHA